MISEITDTSHPESETTDTNHPESETTLSTCESLPSCRYTETRRESSFQFSKFPYNIFTLDNKVKHIFGLLAIHLFDKEEQSA